MRPGWRDPRLAVGVLLLCGSVLLGARVLAAADDTVAVWGAASSLARGQEVSAADLVPVQVRFTDSAAADRYVAAADDLPDGSLVTRDIGAGELLPRAAIGVGTAEELVEVPLAVEPSGVPSSVQVGARVDVWVTPGAGGRAAGGGDPVEAVRVLTDVAVVADGSGGDAAGDFAGQVRPLVVGVPPSAQDELPEVLARLSGGTVVLVRRQG